MLCTGVDLIEIERVQQTLDRHRQAFLKRCFTAQEQRDCNGRIESLAARFAAKEAVAKALGTGIGPVSFLEIEVRRGAKGQPQLYLSGQAATRAQTLGIQQWSLSLSHSRGLAVAFVVGLSD
jgi:holo-[acyl-carrier protein] synthase